MVDVAGHGVSAALFAATLSNMLRPQIEQGGILKYSKSLGTELILPPRAVADELSRRFPFQAETGAYFTMLYGVLDVKNEILQYVRAGHPKPVIISTDGIRSLESGNPPIGIIDGYVFEDATVELKSGDRFLIYSDGLLEQQNDKGDMFSERRLNRTLEACLDKPLDDTLQAVVGVHTHFTGEVDPQDDISMLLIGATPNGN